MLDMFVKRCACSQMIDLSVEVNCDKGMDI